MAPWPLPVEYHHGSSILWLSPEIGLTYRRIQLSPTQYSEFWQQHVLPVRLGPLPPPFPSPTQCNETITRPLIKISSSGATTILTDVHYVRPR